MDPLTIGAITGGVLGAVFIVILVVLIVYVCKRMKKRTNARAKLITSNGEVYQDKWRKEFKGKSGMKDEKGLYFGDVDRSEHVVVTERRRHEARPPPAVLPPPPTKLMISQPPPPPPPQPSPPRMIRRYSLPRRQPEPTFKRRPSFSTERPAQYFMYGQPYQYPNGTYGTWIPQANKAPEPAAPPPPKPAPAPAPIIPMDDTNNDIEEQERVFVVDDMMTEKTFNPRWQGTARVDTQGQTSAAAVTPGYEYAYNTTAKASEVPVMSTLTKEVPRIVTEVM